MPCASAGLTRCQLSSAMVSIVLYARTPRHTWAWPGARPSIRPAGPFFSKAKSLPKARREPAHRRDVYLYERGVSPFRRVWASPHSPNALRTRGSPSNAPPLPAPWSVRELEQVFRIEDANGQAVAYTYFRRDENEAQQARVLTHDEARRSRRISQSCPSCCPLSARNGRRPQSAGTRTRLWRSW